MSQTDDATQAFLAEVAGIRLKAERRDSALLRLGSALMPVGVLVAVLGYFQSHKSSDALVQRDSLIIAIIGLALVVVGGILFLRYSLAEFLRFWMARLVYQQQVAASGGSGAEAADTPSK